MRLADAVAGWLAVDGPLRDLTVTRTVATLALPVAAERALLAAILVAAGSCVRGQLLLAFGLPLTLIGLGLAASAMWHAGENDSADVDCRISITGALVLVALVGLFAPTVGEFGYDALKRGYYLAGLVAVGLMDVRRCPVPTAHSHQSRGGRHGIASRVSRVRP